ncbi:hypothetical protein PI125_g9690 [Phytophthora idaei]|nr:hypothetical protein PI125_g9690 [Phytophthora idaei]
MLIATLCYLAGGSYFDIRRTVGISRPSYCRVVDLSMTAIISQSELQIRFPESDSEKEIVMADFREKSSGRIISGCVGCVKSNLCRLKTQEMGELEICQWPLRLPRDQCPGHV